MKPLSKIIIRPYEVHPEGVCVLDIVGDIINTPKISYSVINAVGKNKGGVSVDKITLKDVVISNTLDYSPVCLELPFAVVTNSEIYLPVEIRIRFVGGKIEILSAPDGSIARVNAGENVEKLRSFSPTDLCENDRKHLHKALKEKLRIS